MAWVDVTSVDDDRFPDTVTKHVINSDNVTRITEQQDGKARLYFSVATDKSQMSLPVEEQYKDLVAEIRKQDGF